TLAVTYSTGGGNVASQLGFTIGQNNVAQTPAMGRYKIQFNTSSASTGVAVGTTVDAGTSTASAVLTEEDLSFRPAVIALGDINGDGFDDFITGVKDNVTASGATV